MFHSGCSLFASFVEHIVRRYKEVVPTDHGHDFITVIAS